MRIAVVPGDGIGKEVVAEGLKVLGKVEVVPIGVGLYLVNESRHGGEADVEFYRHLVGRKAEDRLGAHSLYERVRADRGGSEERKRANGKPDCGSKAFFRHRFLPRVDAPVGIIFPGDRGSGRFIDLQPRSRIMQGADRRRFSSVLDPPFSSSVFPSRLRGSVPRRAVSSPFRRVDRDPPLSPEEFCRILAPVMIRVQP